VILYEIRVLKRSGGPVIMVTHHVSDFAAVRYGHTLAQQGDGLEVWTDKGCIYSGAAAGAPAAQT
jgi:hypothetical protein